MRATVAAITTGATVVVIGAKEQGVQYEHSCFWLLSLVDELKDGQRSQLVRAKF